MHRQSQASDSPSAAVGIRGRGHRGRSLGDARVAELGAVTRIAFTICPSHIITITAVRAITSAPLVVVRLDSVRARAPAHRERVVIVAVVFVLVTWMAFISAVTRIEVHTSSA